MCWAGRWARQDGGVLIGRVRLRRAGVALAVVAMLPVVCVPGFDAAQAALSGAESVWSTVASPAAVRVRAAEFHAITCMGASSCFAVGSTSGLGHVTFVEHWDGHSWAVVPTAIPGPGLQVELDGVACASATACFAVGGMSQNMVAVPPQQPLLERWDGSTWSVDSFPLPGGAT